MDHSFIDKETSTWQYIVACPKSQNSVIIGPVLNLDSTQSRITTSSADTLLDMVASHRYIVVRLLETRTCRPLDCSLLSSITLTFPSSRGKSGNLAIGNKKLAASYNYKVPICTGRRIQQVQITFADMYNIPKSDLDCAFDRLFQDDESFSIGHLSARVLHLPGHTPDHSGYLIDGNVFTGDSIFNSDVGGARCDFPNGDADVLFQSMQK